MFDDVGSRDEESPGENLYWQGNRQKKGWCTSDLSQGIALWNLSDWLVLLVTTSVPQYKPFYGRYACLFNFIVYVFISIQEPSVPLAIQLLDGTSFRPGGKTLMSVSVAQFQQRGKFHDLLKPH